MSKILSLLGFGGKNASGPDGLDAARTLIDRVSKDERANFIAPLRKALAKHPNIAAAFAWLHAHERRDSEDMTAMVMLTMLFEGPMFSPPERRHSAKVAADELEKALRDKEIHDDVKIDFLPLLDLAGRPVDDAGVREFFWDYEAASKRKGSEFLNGLSDSPASLNKLLLVRGIISEEQGAENAPASIESASELLILGHNAAQVENPTGATLMTAALIFRIGAANFSHERSPGQLDDIHLIGTPRARWCLETLSNWPGFSMPFRNKAAGLAAELGTRGITSQAPLAPDDFSHGIVTMVDGMGSRSATLFFRTPKGGLDAFTVLLNDEVGIKDARAFFENGNELSGIMGGHSEEMPTADATPQFFRELLADAFARHEELGTAPPGSLFPLMAYLGNEPVAPRKREPNLDGYKLGGVSPTPELVVGGEGLVDRPLFGCLAPASDAAYAFCEAHWDKRRKTVHLDSFPIFLREIMPLERERLLHRMAINLEIEALAGRAGRKGNQIAARLWLGMKENVLPFWSIPFVQELASIGIGSIVDDLRRGWKNQRAAFEASERDVKKRGEALGRSLNACDLAALPSAEKEAVFTGLLRQLFGDAGPAAFRPPEFHGQAPVRRKPRRNANNKETAAKGGWVYAGPPEKKDKPSGVKRTAPAKNRIIYRLSVDVRGFPPAYDDFMCADQGIVREIEIAGDQTLDKLHLTIFKAFDRDDMHAYEFQFSDKPMDPDAHRYTHPDMTDDDSAPDLVHNAATTTLDQLGLTVGKTFLYWFDFGDDWWHGITVKEIGSPTLRSRYPRIVARHGISPPQYPEE